MLIVLIMAGFTKAANNTVDKCVYPLTDANYNTRLHETQTGEIQNAQTVDVVSEFWSRLPELLSGRSQQAEFINKAVSGRPLLYLIYKNMPVIVERVVYIIKANFFWHSLNELNLVKWTNYQLPVIIDASNEFVWFSDTSSSDNSDVLIVHKP